MNNVLNRRRLAAGVVAILAIGFVALSGCTMVGDKLTGVALSRGNPAGCIQECNGSFKEKFKEEQRTHLENVENCMELSSSDKDACLTTERARHSSAMQSLTEQKNDCITGCHHQGRGSAG